MHEPDSSPPTVCVCNAVEYIDGENIVFPSVEYVVPQDPVREPVLTHVCEMHFDSATQVRGNVTSCSLNRSAWCQPFVSGSRAVSLELQRRGYRSHFGIDAVAPRGEVFMLDLNARRTGSTHVHDFGVRFFGPNYVQHRTVGHYDFYGVPKDTTLTDVLDRLSSLVRAPGQSDSGVAPCELTGLATGRLSCLIYAPSLTGFHDLTRQVHDALQQD